MWRRWTGRRWKKTPDSTAPPCANLPNSSAMQKTPFSSGAWASPSIPSAATGFRRFSTSLWREATSAATKTASCRSAAIPRCKAVPRWEPMPPLFPATNRSLQKTPKNSQRNTASPFPIGLECRRPKWSRPANAASLISFTAWVEIFSAPCQSLTMCGRR